MSRKRADNRKDMIVTSLALEEDLHRRLAIAAVEDHAAMTYLAREAIRQWLERRDRKKERKAR